MTLRDTLYYKVLPFILRSMEYSELSEYNRQKRKLAKVQASGTAHLLLTHGRGGGADKHVSDAATSLEIEGRQAWVLYFDPLRRQFYLSRGKIRAGNAAVFTFPAQYAAMVVHLQTLGIAHFHIHHTRYLPLCLLQDLPKLASYLGVTYDYTLHDYTSFCPRIHLINAEYHYCGMPQEAAHCNACIRKNGVFTVATKDMKQWRAIGRKLLSYASEIIAPSHDTANRHKAILGDLNIKVIPHGAPSVQQCKLPAKPHAEPYVIAVIGRIHRYKGADVLLACAYDAKARNLPLTFKVIGDCSHEKELRATGVTVTGIFQETALPLLLEHSGASLVFLPSVWPETYSYVLSQIWQNGYYPVAFDIGAPAERIRAANNGLVLPFTMVDSPSAITDSLLDAARKQHE